MRPADATRGGWSRGGRRPAGRAPELYGRGVTVHAGPVALLRDVDVSIRPGRITAVVGRNGAGKSTLLRALAGEAPLHRGEVALEGRPLGSWPLCDVARRRAVLPQRSTLTFAFPVEEVVGLGRMPHARTSSADRDRSVVEAALRRAGADELVGRSYPTLSGGERQRVHLARVLAQIWEPPAEGGRYLLLDEPLSAQDLGRQHRMMTLLREVAEEGVGVMVVVHDLNLAARYAHEILVLKDGTRRACGAPGEILRPEVVEEAFGVPVAVVSDPVHGGPLVLAQDPTRASRPPERRSVAAGSIHEPSPRYDP